MNPTPDNGVTDFLANINIPTVVGFAFLLTVIRLALLMPYFPRRIQKAGEAGGMARSAAEFLESLIVAGVLVFLIIRPFFVQAFYIPSQSMEPTLLGHNAGDPGGPEGRAHEDSVHDHLFVNKMVYRTRDPHPGEIIVFKAPRWADSESPMRGMEPQENILIKRCIAVGGQTVEVKADGVYVDGKRLPEEPSQPNTPDPKRYIKEKMREGLLSNFRYASAERTEDGPGPDGQPLPPAGPLKLKPNQIWVMGDNRNDSNDSRYWGPLDRSRVIGKASFIFWPLHRLRTLSPPEGVFRQ